MLKPDPNRKMGSSFYRLMLAVTGKNSDGIECWLFLEKEEGIGEKTGQEWQQEVAMISGRDKGWEQLFAAAFNTEEAALHFRDLDTQDFAISNLRQPYHQ